MLPIYIFHLGNQEYFKKCVTINALRNKVYLIGDTSNQTTFSDNSNVTYIHIDSFQDQELDKLNRMKACFVNYSTNNHTYELNCFLRVFYLDLLIRRTGIPAFFHVDSDCIVLEDLSKVPLFNNSQICYMLQTFSQQINPFHMVGSIHSSLLTAEFCSKFIELCFDVYENKTKFYLVKAKLDWHRENRIPGGICDMTFYYLLYSEKIVDVKDLNECMVLDGEPCVFDHQMTGPYGYLGGNTYTMTQPYKNLYMTNGKFYMMTRTNILVRALSLHFQGNSKQILLNLNEKEC